ncbi:MAG TPA: ATP-dependent DNA ligase [Candidatus Dormibacteraeota bacterium]|jgi:DNA ligase-1|nr:ATP-dependent DNA ligase [Candidatus Dormibacteraeota bacterium]
MRRFAECADAIAATSSKLEKVRILGEYLASLDVDRLAVATRFMAGRIFPAWDGRVLMVGWAAMRTVVLELTGAGDTEMAASYRRHADSGDVMRDLMEAAGHAAPGLDILEVAAGFDRIAATTGSSRARTVQLTELLRACTPAEGRYVTKLISGDMRIGLREGLVEEAVARAFDRPAAAVARADMLMGDLGAVAVLAAGDRLAEAAPRLGAPLRYMLASPVADAAEVVARMGEEVWVEDKYDGIRCQLHKGPERTALYSRDLREITGQFPEIVAAAAELDGDLVLDGELLGFRDGRVMPFFDLQTRLGRKSPSAAVLEAVPVVFTAWDLLHQGGEWLLDTPLRERRARLEALRLGGRFAVAHLERATGAAEVDALFLDARARLNEGLMAKNPDSSYTPGRRGLAWLKLKRPLDTLDCVVVGAEWGHGKRRGVLSDVTFAVRIAEGSDELATVGKAYTGLTDAEIAEMTRLLLDSTVQDHGHHRSVRPEIVVEIAFDSVQPSTRHRSGYALRFPRIARWRHDKGPEDIDTLERVRQIATALVENREQRVDQA